MPPKSTRCSWVCLSLSSWFIEVFPYSSGDSEVIFGIFGTRRCCHIPKFPLNSAWSPRSRTKRVIEFSSYERNNPWFGNWRVWIQWCVPFITRKFITCLGRDFGDQEELSGNLGMWQHLRILKIPNVTTKSPDESRKASRNHEESDK